jgi:hypothetical protein
MLIVAAPFAAGREGERSRADALRDRLEVLQPHAEVRAGRAENDVFELNGPKRGGGGRS